MDASERARLRALCEAATPGPWQVDECPDDRVMHECGDGWHHVDDPVRCIKGDDAGPDSAMVFQGVDADLALMAAARTAIPTLLGALDAAEARAVAAERERDALRDEIHGHRAHTDRAIDGIRAALPQALAAAREDEREACAAVAAKTRESTYGAGSPAPTRGCAFCPAEATVLRADAHGLGICRGCIGRAAAICGDDAGALRAELAAVTRERDEARAEVAEYDKASATLVQKHGALVRELDAVRAELVRVEAARRVQCDTARLRGAATLDAGPRDADGREVEDTSCGALHPAQRGGV